MLNIGIIFNSFPCFLKTEKFIRKLLICLCKAFSLTSETIRHPMGEANDAELPQLLSSSQSFLPLMEFRKPFFLPWQSSLVKALHFIIDKIHNGVRFGQLPDVLSSFMPKQPCRTSLKFHGYAKAVGRDFSSYTLKYPINVHIRLFKLSNSQ